MFSVRLLFLLAALQFPALVRAQTGKVFMHKLSEASKLPIKLYPNHDMPMLQPWNGSVSHDPLSKNVIFSLNFPDHIFGMYNIASFLGSARKFHDGDIVMALPSTVPLNFLEEIARYDVVIYLLSMSNFEGHEREHMFHFDHLPPSTAMPVAQTRYMVMTNIYMNIYIRMNIYIYDWFMQITYIISTLFALIIQMYQYWALKYQRKASILVSDFRDVFFQSNPFTYREDIWNRKGNNAMNMQL